MRAVRAPGRKVKECMEAAKIGAAQGHFWQRGSHAVMQKRTETSIVTVPVPLHDEIRAGTLQSVIRQSGLARLLVEYE